MTNTQAQQAEQARLARIRHIDAELAKNPDMRARVAVHLVDMSWEIGMSLSALVVEATSTPDVDMPKETRVTPPDGGFELKVKVTEVDVPARRMTVSIPKGYPVQQGKDEDTRLYAYTPVGRVTVARSLVKDGRTTERISRRTAITNATQSVRVGGTYTHTAKTLEFVPALSDKATPANTPAPQANAQAAPTRATKTSIRAAKKAARREELIRQHKAGMGVCTCTVSGHLCKAVREGWTPK